MSRRLLLPALAVALILLGCSSSDDDTAAPTTTQPAVVTTTAPTATTAAPLAYPLDDTLRLNQIQVLGSHNSFHIEAPPPLLDAIRGFDADLAATLEYGHPPLPEQFDEEGIRQIELDVFADPDGGLYANPVGRTLLTGDAANPDPAMSEPGFKVLHVQDVDFLSTCSTFVACLTIVRDWSLAHPGHVPIMILVEAKEDAIPDPGLGFVVPLPVRGPELDALDAEIRSVFGDDEVLTPDDVRGGADSLESVVTGDGWPTLGDVRGQVLFALDNGGEVLDAYVAGHPALEGRMLFTSSPRGTPEAAFLKLNDAIGDEAEIRDAVASGYMVRTRADADTVEARTGDTATLEAALRGGAQWVSTDYPVDDPRFPPVYVAAIPDGTPGRCNPVNAPPDCQPTDVENPAALGP